jgi:energy-coupling factor transport system ATP-binding protein
LYEGRASAALDGVDLEVRRGELVAVLGANGSGKSTLARVLNGMVRPTAGEVRGADARAVGFVFQNPDHQIFCASVEEEVAFGPRNQGVAGEELRRRVARALETVGLAGAERRDPFAMAKSDRQRLALASVLAMETPVVLMDEPTTGLDHRDQRRMMDLLAALNARGHTVIVITHHIWIALEYARRIVLLAGGRKVADGPVREVMRDARALEEARVRLPPLARTMLRLGVAARTLEEAVGALFRDGPRAPGGAPSSSDPRLARGPGPGT